MIIVNYAFVGNTADQMRLLAYNHCTTQAFSVFRKRILKERGAAKYSYSASVTNWMIMQLYLKMEIFLVLIQNHQVN